jgi:hypothetical protein
MTDAFKISMVTPIGKKDGTIRLTNDNGVLSGYIKVMGSISYIKDGTITGNSFEFSGILHAAFFQFKYHATGTIEGDSFKAVASTNSGAFQINGTRITA